MGNNSFANTGMSGSYSGMNKNQNNNYASVNEKRDIRKIEDYT